MKVVEIKSGVFGFICPGCRGYHIVHVERANSNNAQWQFNGVPEKPTFEPSHHIKAGADTICHLYIRNGVLEFQKDCPHALSGKKVPMKDLTKAEIKSLKKINV
jgi:hypothetical protein